MFYLKKRINLVALLSAVALTWMTSPVHADTYYSTPGTASPDRSVHVALRVPGNATVWFDGAKTQQTGPNRQFVSPPVSPNATYTYEIRVQWLSEGRTVERQRRVTVHAGEWITLDIPESQVPQRTTYGASTPDSSEYRGLPRGTSQNSFPSRSVAPLDTQSPMNGFGPPGSNDPWSTGGSFRG
jgi:uncharacterized protein (TIGR03000 family)